jgi:chemosensory pili system protein ChpA (sensor histidine kinase/response regulator)
VERRWGDCITLVSESGAGFDDEALEFPPDPLLLDANAEEPEDFEAITPDQCQMILAAVEQQAGVSESVGENASARAAVLPQQVANDAVTREPAAELAEIDQELRQAFLDDAARCMASIEEAILAFESDSKDRQPLQQICRELHTLKGASASIGLSQLAQMLHEIEDTLQTAAQGKATIDVDSLLGRMDEIRRQVATVGGRDVAQHNGVEKATQDPARAATVELAHQENTVTAEASLRVRTSQLDRLMDMLAELVMLRNRRQSGVEQLRQIHDDLKRMVTQLQLLSDTVGDEAGAPRNPARHKKLGETTNDLADISRLLRELFEPLAADNRAVSGFIGQFRHELVALRRMPIATLFQRMRRVARDTARQEGKQVRLEFDGEQTGVEGALQERLYEPLLHMVRNAVGHGIESPQDRTAAGKESVGRVLLTARRVGHLLQLELRDDGRGLDYEALRRRGIERGMLSPGHASSRRELAQLIFHPGFTTRDVANEVAGRGVGMDVVASTLEKMRSWIEVDSTPGRGTTIQMTIPLPSVIEHVMVFACCGQLYGLPMQFIHNVEGLQAETTSSSTTPVHFANLIGLSASESTPTRLLIEAHRQTCGATEGAQQVSRTLPLDVDEISGPEEVVVRPLPPLLKQQCLFSGLTLAGNGAIVLLLDPRNLQQRLEEAQKAGGTVRPAFGLDDDPPKILVVDDSRTARQSIVRALKCVGIGAVEASDGVEALQVLREKEVAAVFCDIEMPRLSGLELLSQIRASETWSAMPVFIVSSRDEDEFRQKTKRLGATAHLAKPVSEELIANVVSRLFGTTHNVSSQEAAHSNS